MSGSNISFTLGSGRKQSKELEANTKARTHIKVEYDVDINMKIERNQSVVGMLEEKFKKEEVTDNPPKRKGKAVRTGKVKKEKLQEADKWEPENWRELLQNIKSMRQDEDAPVDSQGCERTADETESAEVDFL